MSLKQVLDAQKSGELDLLPGSAFNQTSPLTIEEGYAFVMIDGVEWYAEEITLELVEEALQMIVRKTDKYEITKTQIVNKIDNSILYSGAGISDLFCSVAADAGIYTERY